LIRIGIFWIYKESLLGHASPVSEGEKSCLGLVDSSANHTNVWDEDGTLLADCPELRGQEYFSIPRGRVLWNEAEQYAIVYMDATLFDRMCKELILDFFNLGGCEVKWKKDAHYMTDPEALLTLLDDG